MGIIDNSMIKIEIDGIEFSAKRGSKIIEIADEAGIYIPRFCYHKKLSIAANCRMCLVEVEKAPKLFPACATPIADGMKIFTNTEKVIDAQRSVMEFLLINHPLDCPICDQGGECELQDLTIGYGCSSSRFIEKKRSFTDYDLGPLVSTDVTRCILCSRCVRFCEEIAGTNDLGIINRGSNSRIFTFLKNHLTSEISGNVIDLCPVGALTAKPSKFKFRAWELVQHPFIGHHDCVGSNLYVHVFRDKIIRVVPKRNELLNESWISNRDRFSYEGLYSKDKLRYPIFKDNGMWKKISWDNAYKYIFDNLTDIKNKFGSDQLGCVASSNSTIEELFLLQKFIRSLGSNNLDHRLKQLDFSNQDKYPFYPGLNMNFDDIDKMDCVFLIGSDIVNEQPIIALKLRKIIRNGGKVFVLNPVDFSFSMNLTGKFIVNPREFLSILKLLVKGLSDKINKSDLSFKMDSSLDFSKFNNVYKNFIDIFLEAKNKLILLGSFVYSSPDYSKIVSISTLLSKLTKSNYGIMTDGTNSNGAWLTGFIPHRLPGGKVISKDIGLDTFGMFSKGLKSYVLFGLEVEHDLLYPKLAIDSLIKSDFVVSFSSFKSDVLLEVSNIILPIASTYENSGTFLNISGVYQSFLSVVPCDNEVKLGWCAISEMAKFFKIPGFYYKDISLVLKEFKSYINSDLILSWDYIGVSDLSTVISKNVIMVPSIYQYDNDSVVRRAISLQKVKDNKLGVLKCNKNTYDTLNLKQNILCLQIDGKEKEYSVFIDESLSNNIVFIDSYNVLNYRDFKLPYESILVDKV